MSFPYCTHYASTYIEKMVEANEHCKALVINATNNIVHKQELLEKDKEKLKHIQHNRATLDAQKVLYFTIYPPELSLLYVMTVCHTWVVGQYSTLR